MVKRPSSVYWYVLLILVILVMSMLLTPSSPLLELTDMRIQQYRTLSMVSNVAYFISWFSAFYAFYSLSSYTKKLKKASEAKSFNKITKGIMILAWGLPLSMLVSLVLRAISYEYGSVVPLRVYINGFLPLIFSIIAFIFVSIGANALSKSTRKYPSIIFTYASTYIFIVFAALYTHFTLSHSVSNLKMYHMSEYPLMLSVIAPTLFAWFLGILAAYGLINYHMHVKGLIYKHAIANLSAGISLVVLSDIFSHFLDSVYGARTYTTTGSLFLLIYLLILIQAGGFLLIARGAMRLKRIEEI